MGYRTDGCQGGADDGSASGNVFSKPVWCSLQRLWPCGIGLGGTIWHPGCRVLDLLSKRGAGARRNVREDGLRDALTNHSDGSTDSQSDFGIERDKDVLFNVAKVGRLLE
jgi:hypothetical protein